MTSEAFVGEIDVKERLEYLLGHGCLSQYHNDLLKIVHVGEEIMDKAG